MELQLLQASYGDAIHIRFEDESNVYRNILIDGGLGATYTFKQNKKTEAGALKNLVDQLRSQNENIDLLIMTHIDDDHIGGILKWFENDAEAMKLVKKVWFNSGRLISEYFKQEEIKENELDLSIVNSLNTSIKQGATFEDYIEEHGIWDRRILKSNDVIYLFGLRFVILSPTEEKMKNLLKKWDKDIPILDTSRATDHQKSLTELIKADTFKEDDSIPNGASIAFIMKYKSKQIMFLGDAHPKPIIESLKKRTYSIKKKVKAHFVKLSHHGSKANTNYELLDLINSANYLISTDSNIHGHPDKACLARIINNKQKVNLYFNYPALPGQIFSEQDFADFPDIKICDAQAKIKI